MDQVRGSKSRSFFMREALANYIRSLGVSVTDDMIYPPDRTSSGASSYSSTSPSPAPPHLNDSPFNPNEIKHPEPVANYIPARKKKPPPPPKS